MLGSVDLQLYVTPMYNWINLLYKERRLQQINGYVTFVGSIHNAYLRTPPPMFVLSC